MTAALKVSANTLLGLLAIKHSNDVFVPECKNGPTQTAGARQKRMDAWVMPRSWAHPGTTGYEIKVSRGDFLRDQKWPAYLDLCNYFYFVAPQGIIKPEEIPDTAGLITLTKSGTRLITKKRAPHRKVEHPENLFRYILMCRAKICHDGWDMQGGSVDYWQRWLAEKDSKKLLGYNVSKKVREIVEERVTRANLRSIKHEQENERLEGVREILAAIGIESALQWNLRKEVADAIRATSVEGIDDDLLKQLEAFSDAATSVAESALKAHELLSARVDGDAK